MGTQEGKKKPGAGCGCISLLVVFAVAYAIIKIAGGDSSSAAQPAPATTVSASDPAVVDAAFAGLVQSDQPSMKSFSMSQIAASGRQVCSDVRAGMSVHDEAVALMAVYGAKGAGAIIGLAPQAYCKDLDAQISAGLKKL